MGKDFGIFMVSDENNLICLINYYFGRPHFYFPRKFMFLMNIKVTFVAVDFITFNQD